MHAVTIAARNYLSMARTLAKSFKEANPDHGITILLVDADPGEVTATEDYDIATPADLTLSAEEFGRMALLYDVTELSTALKPWALEMLLDRGADVAIYLDPDIFVYDSLTEIEKQSLTSGIVLTPHTSRPMPRDGLRPTEADIMGAGTFNLGFIAVSKNDRKMLEWWQARLSRDSISAPELMLFTDQRWIDLVPSYFSHYILRDPGYNVAYWNLDHREITVENGRFFVESAPLRFFHFSGYRPETPWILSKYVADNPRVVLSEHPAVRELCERYRVATLDAGLEESAAIPYRFNRFRDGTAITQPMRRIYRKAVLDADKSGSSYPPSLSAEDGDAAILAWFKDPVGPSNQLNRLVYGLWLLRHDLQAAFPDPFGVHTDALLDWCMTSGITDKQIVAALMPSANNASDEADVSIQTSAARGVNVAGYFQAEMGVGQIGRLLVDAVKASGHPYSTLRSTATISRQDAGFDDESEAVRYRLNLVSVNADQFPNWVKDVGSEILHDRYTVGIWAWEVEDFPDAYGHALTLVDEVWAISSFVQQAIARKTTKPVYVIPYQLGSSPRTEPLDRQALGIPDHPYFLFMFDYLSIFDRKNPIGLISAFKKAFPTEGEAVLVVKAINGERFRSQREQLRHAAGNRSDIHLIEEYLDRDVISALSANAVAYVSLHRAEGLGLTLAESMAAGRPVIATAYSGNLDFMTEQDSLLIPYKMVDIPATAAPYATTGQWAEPDLDAAAAAMRWVIDNPAKADELGQRAREHALSTASLDRTVDFISGRIAAIYELLDPPPIEELPPPAAPFIQRARTLLNTAPNVTSPSRAPLVAKRVRQVLYRALAHHDEHVNERLYAITGALEASDAETHALTKHLTERVDSLAAELRESVTPIPEIDAKVEQLRARADDLAARTQAASERIDVVNSSLDDTKLGLMTQAERVDALSDISDQHGLRIDIERERTDSLAQVQPRLEATVRSHGAQFYDLVSRVNTQSSQLEQLDNEQAADPYRADTSALRILDTDGHEVMGYNQDEGGVGEDYASFEDVYRGSEEFIASRLKSYVETVREHQPVLDIGCGRGEFLALLKTEGIQSRGVDLDESMVRRSRELDLDVELADAVALLDGAQPESLGAITSFQVVEHISPEAMTQLFRSTFRALQPGGVMIAETVNPHSPAGLKTFWLDLTHVRPLFPESLLFLARECGFRTAKIVFPHVSGDLRNQMRHSGEYALVAYK